MSKVEDLLKKLNDVSEYELASYSGEKPRRFFIETIGAKSIDDLLDMFDGQEHNEQWDKERQKDVVDQDAIMKQRRAVAFLASGKLDVFKHYCNTELSSNVNGRAVMLQNMDLLKQAEYFLTMDSVIKV